MTDLEDHRVGFVDSKHFYLQLGSLIQTVKCAGSPAARRGWAARLRCRCLLQHRCQEGTCACGRPPAGHRLLLEQTTPQSPKQTWHWLTGLPWQAREQVKCNVKVSCTLKSKSDFQGPNSYSNKLIKFLRISTSQIPTNHMLTSHIITKTSSFM